MTLNKKRKSRKRNHGGITAALYCWPSELSNWFRREKLCVEEQKNRVIFQLQMCIFLCTSRETDKPYRYTLKNHFLQFDIALLNV